MQMRHFLFHAIADVTPSAAQIEDAATALRELAPLDNPCFPCAWSVPRPPKWADVAWNFPDPVVEGIARRRSAPARLLSRICDQITPSKEEADQLWSACASIGLPSRVEIRDLLPAALIVSKNTHGLSMFGSSPARALAALYVIKTVLRAGVGGEGGLTGASPQSFDDFTLGSLTRHNVDGFSDLGFSTVTTPEGECAIVLNALDGAQVRPGVLLPWLTNGARRELLSDRTLINHLTTDPSFERGQLSEAHKGLFEALEVLNRAAPSTTWDAAAANAHVRHYTQRPVKAEGEPDDGIDG